jgi:hypothetical protein
MVIYGFMIMKAKNITSTYQGKIKYSWQRCKFNKECTVTPKCRYERKRHKLQRQ